MIKEACQRVREQDLEKIAGEQSEFLGMLLPLISGIPVYQIPAVAGIVAGLTKGPYSKKEKTQADSKMLSNLIPGVGGYRWGRRATTEDKDYRKKMLTKLMQSVGSSLIMKSIGVP